MIANDVSSERRGFPLTNRTRLRVTGADRLRYLNGQLTQDIRRVTDQLSLPSCITSAKGRLQAEVWVVAERTDASLPAFLLDAPEELREPLLIRLERYIISEEVFVEDVTGSTQLIHVPFAEVPEALAREGYSRSRASRLGVLGWDVWVPSGCFADACKALGAALGSEADFERLRIQRGIPIWGAELNEETLPPEAGLEKTHVDYHKGCYIGQEVISRLKSVGHVNRTIRKLHTRGTLEPVTSGRQIETPPLKGDSLYATPGRENAAGILTSVVSDGANGFHALGYIRRGMEGAEFQTTAGWRFTLEG
jgi:folate-binding protein YgfZ